MTQTLSSGGANDPRISERTPSTHAKPDERVKQAGHVRSMIRSVSLWFDNSRTAGATAAADRYEVDWYRIIPFIGLHLMCLAVIWVGWSPIAIGVAAALYVVRMFAITGFYHRYFSHRTFKTSRAGQFVFAVAGNTAVQRGPLWWAAHHRHHHRYSDQDEDRHSPRQHGFFWAHVGWITSKSNFDTNLDAVQDLAKYPELRFLNRFDNLIPLLLGIAVFCLGVALETWAPQLGTSGFQMLVWGFFVSTIFVAHATFTINSLTHIFGRKRYKSKDDSRNNVWLALLTLGEGWHNNHHYYPGATRQGFYWWEIDLTYYALVALSSLGIIWDLNPVPDKIRASNHVSPA